MRDPLVHGRQFQFAWDDGKALANVRNHGVPFELARSVFKDPRLLTVADLEHSDIEDRWFSIGCATNGTMLSVVYLWSDADPATTKIRLISARKATQNEIMQYQSAPEPSQPDFWITTSFSSIFIHLPSIACTPPAIL